MPDSTFEIWLAALTARALVDGTLIVSAPDEIRTWVIDRFARVLQTCAAAVLGADTSVDVVEVGLPERDAIALADVAELVVGRVLDGVRPGDETACRSARPPCSRTPADCSPTWHRCCAAPRSSTWSRTTPVRSAGARARSRSARASRPLGARAERVDPASDLYARLVAGVQALGAQPGRECGSSRCRGPRRGASWR